MSFAFEVIQYSLQCNCCCTHVLSDCTYYISYLTEERVQCSDEVCTVT